MFADMTALFWQWWIERRAAVIHLHIARKPHKSLGGDDDDDDVSLLAYSFCYQTAGESVICTIVLQINVQMVGQ